jgi:hypothetical protein
LGNDPIGKGTYPCVTGVTTELTHKHLAETGKLALPTGLPMSHRQEVVAIDSLIAIGWGSRR